MTALRSLHVDHFDAWAGTFGEPVTAMELSPDGAGYRLNTRFARFINVPELMGQFRQVADIQTRLRVDHNPRANEIARLCWISVRVARVDAPRGRVDLLPAQDEE